MENIPEVLDTTYTKVAKQLDVFTTDKKEELMPEVSTRDIKRANA